MLLIEKYKPQSIKEFIGNNEIVSFSLKWAEDWQKNMQRKPLFFFGNTGTGKTLLATLIAKEFNWPLLELNASDFRTKESIERLAGIASQNSTFTFSKRLILIDEVDGLSSEDKGGLNAIIKIVRETKNPLILTAIDIYSDRSLAPLRNLTELMQFKKVNYVSIANYLKKICLNEKIEFEEKAIETIAKNSEGDVRAALLDLENAITAKKISEKNIELISIREREENIFNLLKELFKAKNFSEAKEIVSKSNFDLELLAAWLEENIPSVFDSKDTANSFNELSLADVFAGRIIKRQYYGFKRYTIDLNTVTPIVSREKEYHKWVNFKFPAILKKLSSTTKARNLKKSIALKISEKIHESSKEVMQQSFYLLEILFSNKEQAIRLAAEFDLNEEEIAFILKSKTETKKVETIYEEAQKLKEKNILAKIKKSEDFEEKKEEKKEIEGRQARLI